MKHLLTLLSSAIVLHVLFGKAGSGGGAGGSGGRGGGGNTSNVSTSELRNQFQSLVNENNRLINQRNAALASGSAREVVRIRSIIRANENERNQIQSVLQSRARTEQIANAFGAAGRAIGRATPNAPTGANG